MAINDNQPKGGIVSSLLEGKVAVITGATQGIGFGIAREYISEGAIVVITGLVQDDIDKAVEALGERAFGATVDASGASEMDALLRKVKAQQGRLDVVVCNAAVGMHAPLGKITEEQFDKSIATNLKGIIFTTQSAASLMSSGGSIILIGSTASELPPPGMSVYGAAKAALLGFVRSAVLDMKGLGVRLNVLSPGAVDTPSLRAALAKASGPDRANALVGSIRDRSPSGRLGTSDEIGKVACFLASDNSSYINGIELFADGGLRQV